MCYCLDCSLFFCVRGVEQRVAPLCAVFSSALAHPTVPARCCGRRPPSPASPVVRVSRARVSSLPLSASIAPVFCRSRLPFVRGCLCVCPFPPSLSTLSHPLHSATGGRVPRAPPCIWTASGLRAPPPCCLAAASSVLATHARTLAHSHSRAPRRQGRRPPATHSSRVAGGLLRRGPRTVLRSAGALLGPRGPTSFRCLPPPSHPVPLPARRALPLGGGGPRLHPAYVCLYLGPPTLSLRSCSVRRPSSLGGRTLASSRHCALRALSCPGRRLRSLLSSFLASSVSCVGPLAQRSPVSCARSVLGLVSYRRRCGPVVLLVCAVSSCHAGCPSRVSSMSPSCPSSRLRPPLPYRAVAPRRPRRRRGRAGAVSGLSGPRRSSAGACTVGLARRGCVPRRPG